MEQNSTDKTTLLQEATTLFLRAQECEDGTAVAEMEAWKSQSPQHRETMESVQSLWFAVDDLDDIPDVSIDDVRAAEQPSGLWARFSQYLTSPSVWPAMAAMVLAVGATLWLQLASQSPLPADPLDNRFSTRAAEHQLIRLPDGSELTMGAKSRVNTEYTDTLRRINLDGGEVLFSVAKDPKRPFVVTVNGVEVQAIGTVFNIWNDGANLEVSVLEGKVKVTAENSPLNGASADSAQQTRAGATVYLTQGQSIDHSPTGLGS
ncbi:MAG: FecR domain-containing protein, partial [Porticoccaceae bacterium]|nr:FecR domain-containing protein [Porticoccaceae bacterium]